MRYIVCIGAIAVLAAGCGGQSNPAAEQPTTTAPPPTTTGTTTAQQQMSLELFFLAPDGKLVATSRSVERTQAPGGAALRELTAAPDDATTQVPVGLQLTIAGGQAHVTGATLDDA